MIYKNLAQSVVREYAETYDMAQLANNTQWLISVSLHLRKALTVLPPGYR